MGLISIALQIVAMEANHEAVAVGGAILRTAKRLLRDSLPHSLRATKPVDARGELRLEPVVVGLTGVEPAPPQLHQHEVRGDDEQHSRRCDREHERDVGSDERSQEPRCSRDRPDGGDECCQHRDQRDPAKHHHQRQSDSDADELKHGAMNSVTEPSHVRLAVHPVKLEHERTLFALVLVRLRHNFLLGNRLCLWKDDTRWYLYILYQI